MKSFRQPVPNRARMRGFSLIEMVAAFLVFALGVGVLMQILTESMHSARKSSEYTMAALWAQSKLDTVGVGERIEEGSSNGEFDDNYSWTLEIQQVDPASVEPPPQQAMQPASANGRNQQQGPDGNYVAAGEAGLGGGIDVSPFDLYQVDLTVSWGGRSGQRSHNAHFGTLRAANPETENGTGMTNPLRNPGGGRR
jgi:general secretion pathway protein I